VCSSEVCSSEVCSSEVCSSTEGWGGGKSSIPFKSPRSAQVWFLLRSRRTWKGKYMALKTQAKRLKNRVRDVAASRDRWKQQVDELHRRVAELELRNTALAESGGKSAIAGKFRRDR
jgi:hypothetical protein